MNLVMRPGILRLLFLTFFLLAAGLPGPVNAKGSAASEADEIVVKLASTFAGDIAEINVTYGTNTRMGIPGQLFLLGLPAGANMGAILGEMALDIRIDYAEPNYINESPEITGQDVWAWGGQDPEPYNGQNALEQLNIGAAHTITQGSGTIIAIIDTGIQPDHPGLGANILNGYDFVSDDELPDDEGNGLDDDNDGLIDEAVGHGTHVAGIALLVAPEAFILPIRALDSDGNGDAFQIAIAIQYAVTEGADVINLSLGMGAKSELLKDVIRQASRAGVVVVAAAGNLANDIEQYPAATKCALAVGSVGPEGVKSNFTSYGDWITFMAPGEAIYSTFPGSSYAWWSGSSMATPFVTGHIALIKALNSDLGPRQIAILIGDSARQLDGLNPDFEGLLGVGIPNIYASLVSLQQGNLPDKNKGIMSGGCQSNP